MKKQEELSLADQVALRVLGHIIQGQIGLLASGMKPDGNQLEMHEEACRQAYVIAATYMLERERQR